MAGEGVVIGCHTVDKWNEQFQKHASSGKLVVVDFTASWSGPCFQGNRGFHYRVIPPVLTDFAKKMPHVVFLKVDVDELEIIAQKYSVEAKPTFIFFRNAKAIDKVVGAKKDELLSRIEKHSAAVAA